MSNTYQHFLLGFMGIVDKMLITFYYYSQINNILLTQFVDKFCCEFKFVNCVDKHILFSIYLQKIVDNFVDKYFN